jgi:hypothetical protein
MTLVTREVLAQLTNHRQIHATFAADGSALLRLLNMIMLKILESSNLNSIFAALLNCLLQIPDIVTTRGPTQVHCYLALTVKCLTKITKTRLAEEPVRCCHSLELLWKHTQINQDSVAVLVFQPDSM